ncbi:MAG: hypothetical protein ACREX8_21760 [Gammaproteobacteria bacterium]
MIERGPNSLLDLVLVALAIAVVLVAFYLALRHMLYPGETSADHIKRRILHDDETPP